MIPTIEDEKTWFKFLKDKLLEILEDDLGVYELTSNIATTIPAIYIKNRELNLNQWRMRSGSGVEAIIWQQVGIRREPIFGANILNFIFSVELVQHNLEKTLTVPVTKVLQCKDLIVIKSPIITPLMETPKGIAYGRAIIEIEVSQRIPFI